MLADNKIVEFWTELSNVFNVHVRSIGTGMTQNGNECTVVIVDDQTDPAVIAGLPKKFANEEVEYKTGAAVVAQPACGQPGHQCVCGTLTPKP